MRTVYSLSIRCPGKSAKYNRAVLDPECIEDVRGGELLGIPIIESLPVPPPYDPMSNGIPPERIGSVNESGPYGDSLILVFHAQDRRPLSGENTAGKTLTQLLTCCNDIMFPGTGPRDEMSYLDHAMDEEKGSHEAEGYELQLEEKCRQTPEYDDTEA